MAEKNQQQEVQGHPLAPATVVARSDEESNTNHQSQMKKKKKRMKCLAYIAAFAVIQAIVILVIALVFIRVQTPRIRLQDVTVTNPGIGNIMLSARVSIRNRNFGRYRFDSSVATIRSEGNSTTVGQFVIPEGRARMRSTTRLYVISELASNSSGTLNASVDAHLRGRVEFLRVIRRRRSANMSCTITINLSTSAVQNLRCN